MNPQTASVVRWLVVLVGGFLVARGRLAPEQQDTFVEAAVEAAGGAVALASLFWSMRDKARAGETVRAALALPSHSTPFDLAAAPALGGFKDLLVRQAIATVRALAADKVGRSRFGQRLVELRDALNAAFPPSA